MHTRIALVTGTEDRQWLYPTMTRGTDANLAFVFSVPARPADPRPGTRAAPELGRYDRTRRERGGHRLTQLFRAQPAQPEQRDPIAVLADVHRRGPGSPDPAARQPAAPRPQGLWAERVPHQPDLEHRAYLAEIATMMDDRRQRLGQHAAQTTPAWAITALGPVPEDAAARQDWERHASSTAAYREMYGCDHPGDPIGPEPTMTRRTSGPPGTKPSSPQPGQRS